MRPGEYWAMTPEEFAAVAHGYAVRQAREWHRAAFIVAGLGNMWRKRGSRPLTPEKLLGPSLRALLRGPSARPDAEDDA